MDIPDDSTLLREIESFITANDIAPSKFGRDTIGDGALVFQLREGRRSLTLKTAKKILQHMRCPVRPDPEGE